LHGQVRFTELILKFVNDKFLFISRNVDSNEAYLDEYQTKIKEMHTIVNNGEIHVLI
jgi:hypothetical protein